MEYEEMLDTVMKIADEEAQNGKTMFSFDCEEKNHAVKIANYLRRKYDCFIQEIGGLWYVVVNP